LHGYGISFRVWFVGELDEKNWVFDFGGMKRARFGIEGKKPQDWFNWLLDHTVIIAEDDPALADFLKLYHDGVIQLRILPQVGCERFAEYLLKKINEFLDIETVGRVKAAKVEVYENGTNAASASLS